MTIARKTLAVVLGLAFWGPVAGRAEEPAPGAALAAAEGAKPPEPRQAFWGAEPGRPHDDVDAYTLPVVPIRLSGQFWVDTGYMERVNTQVGAYDQEVNYSQGRFVLGASYRRDHRGLFAEARVQLLGFVNEFTRSQYEPHTQDAFVRLGGRAWDVQVGRFVAWEPYYRGNGIERYTAEESGALGGPPMYRLDFALGHRDEAGQAAVHLYPADWAALELAAVYGQEASQNNRGVRPVVALRGLGLLFVGGWEYHVRRPQDVSNEAEQTAQGFAGRVQYARAGTTVGVNAARVTVDETQIDGLPNADRSFDKTTFGGFVESGIWNEVVGAGYHLTTEDNEQGERKRHHQAFVSWLHRLPVPGLSVKAVLGFGRAQLEDVDAGSKWENDVTSFRVRVQYDLR